MRDYTMMIDERDFMNVVAGQLFDQAPNRQPRNSEIIMKKVRDAFRSGGTKVLGNYKVQVSKDNFYNWVDTMLKEIPEFVDLNLSQNEYEAGVDVDDTSRPLFHVSGGWEFPDVDETWKDDFIDLDAFVQNVTYRFLSRMKEDNDCFLCMHSTKEGGVNSDSEFCKTCVLNRNLEVNYLSSRKPKGDYTISCKYDCYCGRQICCTECANKESCEHVCDGDPKSCRRVWKEPDFSKYTNKAYAVGGMIS